MSKILRINEGSYFEIMVNWNLVCKILLLFISSVFL